MARQKRSSSARITVPPARPPKLTLAPAPLWHRAAEWTLRVLAVSAIVAIVLILVFIAKEAAPIFYSAAVRAEVTLSKMWVPQLWPGYDESASIWQPVSEIPKFGIWPLILGTLKITFVAMLFSIPLGVGAALYVAEYARPRTREILKPSVELLAADSGDPEDHLRRHAVLDPAGRGRRAVRRGVRAPAHARDPQAVRRAPGR